MVTSSNLTGSNCCFDYGSGETDHKDDGNATMNAIEWGTACWFGGCTGAGPWVEADLENGMYSTNTGPNTSNNQGVHFPFVSAWEKNNGTSNFTLKYGNAASGGLTTTYSGSLPSNGYSPMKLQPSILLGTGGDNSVGAPGEFFEGAVTAGFPSDATENSVQAELTTAGYGGGSSGGGEHDRRAARGGRGPVPGRPERDDHAGHAAADLRLQRAGEPDLDPDLRRHADGHEQRDHGLPGRQQQRDGQRHQGDHLAVQRRSQPAVDLQCQRIRDRHAVRDCAWT